MIKKLFLGLFAALSSLSAFALTCELPAWSGEFVNLPPGQAPSPSYPVNPLPDSKAGDPCAIIESLGRVSVWGEPFDRYRYEYAYFKEGPKCMYNGPTQWTFFSGWGPAGSETSTGDPVMPPDVYCDGTCIHQLNSADWIVSCSGTDIGENQKFECTYNYTAIRQSTCTAENSPEETDPPPTGPTSCPEGQTLGEVNGVPTCAPSGDGGDTGGGDTGGGDTGGGDTGGGDTGGGDTGGGDTGGGDTGGGGGGGTDDGTDPQPGPPWSSGSVDFYTPKYPGGMAGVWAEKSAQLQQTGLLNFAAGFVPNFTNTGCPQFSFPSIYGESIPIDVPCYIWAFVKSVILLTAAFLARRLIFGG